MISGICRETDDVTKGLECGADAYLCKPLDRRLVLAELNSVMRRFRTGVEPGVVRGCGVSLDPDARRVRAGRREVPLTRLEFDLLACLLRSQGQVLSTQQLLEKVFGYEPGEHIDPATVHVHISQLRKKLGKTFSARLATLVNSGYRLG